MIVVKSTVETHGFVLCCSMQCTCTCTMHPVISVHVHTVYVHVSVDSSQLVLLVLDTNILCSNLSFIMFKFDMPLPSDMPLSLS